MHPHARRLAVSKGANDWECDGCDQVLNIDFSYPLIKHMTDKTAKDYNPKLEYLCMDVRKMDLQNEIFDRIFLFELIFGALFRACHKCSFEMREIKRKHVLM